MPSVLWLVPARSGSKGLPGKNIRLLGDKPLLAWRIVSALGLPGEVWLSTDSQEYAEIGRRYGAQTPFLRPAELSTDTSSSVDFCLHAIAFADSMGKHFDYLCILQPTSPFVKRESLQNALNLLDSEPDANGAIAVKEAHPNSFLMQEDSRYLDILAERFANKDTRRQALPKEITPCGGFYFIKWDVLKTVKTFFTKNVLAVKLTGEETLDIDNETDFKLCESLLQVEG